ncbi:MAG: tRNA (adenosine(37)-N6)-threonylcarbamoyltransferase complex ATPase subunit type 1 TsaE [Solirubrobacterales bacterium]|nr:tRNA (adenosine(37)-N6)-threonylcarbamoyltransferase complex ATPase subunit type 1 TsaE [Solirubrobacterales bacterium]
MTRPTVAKPQVGPRNAGAGHSRVTGVRGVFTSLDAAQTEELGARLAARLRPGDVVLVAGELGAGKTTFVRGACRRLGVPGPVTSPTFTIGQRYPAAVPVGHVDLYRVASLADEDPDLLADYLGPDAIGFVEWPLGEEPTLAGLGRIVARVSLEHAGGGRRRVEVR